MTRRCAGSARSSSCTSSRAAGWSTSTPGRAWRARSGRTDGGGSTCRARPTTPAPPGWRTGATRCWRYARVVLAAREAAARHGAVATCGKVLVDPERGQRDPVAGHRLARRPRPATRPTCGRWSPRSRRWSRPRAARSPSSPGPARPAFDPTLRERLADAAGRAAGAGDRGRARRRHPGRGRHPDRDAVRAQSDRRLALAGRVRRAGRLPGRGRCPGHACSKALARDQLLRASTPGCPTGWRATCGSR